MCAKENYKFKELKIKLSESSKVTHSLFLRKHIVREQVPEKPLDKTLFASGVPPFLNQKSLEKLFSTFGVVTTVYIHKTPSPKAPPEETSQFFKAPPIGGFKVAYIVFENEKSVVAALKNDKIIVVPREFIYSGIKKWSQEYNDRIPHMKAMEKEIEQFMVEFDAKSEQKKKEEKELGESDANGWVTVTKKGKKPGFARKESVINKIKSDEERRKQKKQLNNFYRFQIKESKMKNLVELRQKFEEDKKRIATMKATRRFKPF